MVTSALLTAPTCTRHLSVDGGEKSAFTCAYVQDVIDDGGTILNEGVVQGDSGENGPICGVQGKKRGSQVPIVAACGPKQDPIGDSELTLQTKQASCRC